MSKGYLPKFGQTKTFDIYSGESKVGTITFTALSQDEALDNNCTKMFRIKGHFDKLSSTCKTSFWKYNKNSPKPIVRLKYELFGDETTKDYTMENVNFEGFLYYSKELYDWESQDKKYTYDIEKVLADRKIQYDYRYSYPHNTVLKEKTGNKVWKENYNVPYPSGEAVDEMKPMTGYGQARTQKEIGQRILDNVEEICNRFQANIIHEEHDAIAEKEMEKRRKARQEEEIQMAFREKRKKQTTVAGLVGAFIIGIGYYFVR